MSSLDRAPAEVMSEWPAEVPAGPVVLPYREVPLGGPHADAAEPTRILVLGGEPFGERIVMWWNFVAHSHEEVVEFRADWQRQRAGLAPETPGAPVAPVAPGRYGVFPGAWENTLPAPDLPGVRLRPRE